MLRPPRVQLRPKAVFFYTQDKDLVQGIVVGVLRCQADEASYARAGRYHMYGMAINHTVTNYASQLRDNNVALLGDRVHARARPFPVMSFSRS